MRVRTYLYMQGFPGGSAGKESTCNAGDLGSIPDSGKIPWRREQLLTPVFWPGEFHGLYSAWGRRETPLSAFHFHFFTTGTIWEAGPPQRNALISPSLSLSI